MAAGKDRGCRFAFSIFYWGTFRAGERRQRPRALVSHAGDRAIRVWVDIPLGVLQLLPLDRTCLSFAWRSCGEEKAGRGLSAIPLAVLVGWRIPSGSFGSSCAMAYIGIGGTLPGQFQLVAPLSRGRPPFVFVHYFFWHRYMFRRPNPILFTGLPAADQLVLFGHRYGISRGPADFAGRGACCRT